MHPYAEAVNYHSKLLRYWQEPNSEPAQGGAPIWRFSLEDVHTGERHGFANLSALFAFLQAQTAPQPARQPEAHTHLPDTAESTEDGDSTHHLFSPDAHIGD